MSAPLIEARPTHEKRDAMTFQPTATRIRLNLHPQRVSILLPIVAVAWHCDFWVRTGKGWGTYGLVFNYGQGGS